MEVVHTGVELLREEPWTVVLVSVQDKAVSDNSWPSSPFSVEEAAGEALNILFGAGRYGSRILGSVGWKEVKGWLHYCCRWYCLFAYVKAWRKLGRGVEERNQLGRRRALKLEKLHTTVYSHGLVPNGLEMRIRTMSSGEGSNLHFKAILNQVPFQAYRRS